MSLCVIDFLWPWNDFLCEKENSLKNKCGIALFVNKINTSKRISGWKKREKHLGVNEREKSEVLFLWECIPHRLASQTQDMVICLSYCRSSN